MKFLVKPKMSVKTSTGCGIQSGKGCGRQTGKIGSCGIQTGKI